VTQALAVPSPAVSGLLASGRGTLAGWVFRESSGGGGGGAAVGAAASFLAGAAGNAALSSTSDHLTGFDVTMAAVAAAAGGTVTVSNVAGGPFVYDIEALVGQATLLSIRFPTSLPPSGGAPTVAISAIVGGGAGNIDIFGITSAAPAVVLLHDGLAANNRLLAVIDIAAAGQTDGTTGGDGVDVTAGIFMEVVTGSVEGVVYADLE